MSRRERRSSGTATRSCTAESISDRTVEIAIDNGPKAIDLLADHRESFCYSRRETTLRNHSSFRKQAPRKLTGRSFTGFDRLEASGREKINETPAQPFLQTSTSLLRREHRKGSLGATVWRRRKGARAIRRAVQQRQLPHAQHRPTLRMQHP